MDALLTRRGRAHATDAIPCARRACAATVARALMLLLLSGGALATAMSARTRSSRGRNRQGGDARGQI